jgi:hypothetical protein
MSYVRSAHLDTGAGRIAQTIRDWCQSSIDFVPDPPGVELLYLPDHMAQVCLGLKQQHEGRILSKEFLSDDDTGRMRTLRRMRHLVARGSRDVYVQHLTRCVVRSEPVCGYRLGVDCDDVATLAASMAKACGLPVQFRALAFDKRRGSTYAHVYTEITVAGGGLMIDVDITRDAQSFAAWPVTRSLTVKS